MAAHRLPLVASTRPALPAALTAPVPAALRALGRESVVVAAAMIAYFGVRNLTAGSASAAIRNAADLLDVERLLGLAWEHRIQAVVIDHDLLVTLANGVYIWCHWPVILSAAVVLFLLHRPHYYELRDAMILSGIVGFAFFALFPVAPPRLLDLGFVDTVVQHSEAYRTLQPPGLTNQYAAFPSLHVGWNLLVGIALYRAFPHPLLRLLALTVPVAMALAVIMTANHFVLDVVAGVLLVVLALRVTEALRRPDAGTLIGDGWLRD